jgi:hypothetical protein
MKVIGQSENWFLLDIGEGFGRVLDLDHDRFFPPMQLVSLLAKGGWHEFHGDQDAVLSRVEYTHDLASDEAEFVPAVLGEQRLFPAY